MLPSQEFVYLRTYSRWLPELKRRETYPETAERYIRFMVDELKERDVVIPSSVESMGLNAILNMEAMPSMRAMWSAGEAARTNHIALYNCSYVAIDNIKAFSEAVYILMSGAGCGFSVEKQYVDQLPELQSKKPGLVEVVVQDSKWGWAEAFDSLLRALWWGYDVRVDYSLVRPRGARLLTMGGRASGPEPLRDLFEFCIRMFAEKRAKKQRKLQSIDCLDIMNKVAEIVVMGGVRRSSEISLSDLDDRQMAEAKLGEFPDHRRMSNNSAVYYGRPDVVSFFEEFTTLIKSRAGERGIFNREGAIKQMTASGRREPWEHVGTNPCVPGYTDVLTKDGYKPIDTLVDQEVEVWNGFEWSTVTPRVTGYNQSLVDVLLSSGQSLTCTPYHEFVIALDYLGNTKRVKAKDLQPGMKLIKAEYPVVEGGDDVSYAYTQGFISGDGMNGYDWTYAYKPKWCCVPYFSAKRVGKPYKDRIVVRFDFSPHAKEFVPLGWSVKSRLYWFAGLLDADGTVLNEGGIQLGSIDVDFLSRVQKMLTTLGTASKVIARHPAGYRSMPDGHGGSKPYYCQQAYALCVGSAEIQRLLSLGLETHRLQLKGFKPNRSAARFVQVVDVVEAGNAQVVYCFTEPLRHLGCFEGVVTGQCSEIVLRNQEFCNLSEVVVRPSDTLETLRRKVKIAAMFGAWQASFTEFPYLRPEWKQNCDAERLLGVSLTGIMDNPVLNNVNDKMKRWLADLKGVAISEAEKWSKRLGINMPAAITCGKPSGTVSQLVHCSSGIHPRHAEYYIRRYRISVTDPLFRLLRDQGVVCHPEVGQEVDTASTWVLEFPIAAPGSTTRHTLNAQQQLEHWKVVKDFWCEHNQSITVYVADHEWASTAAWVYDNFDDILGVSFLPKTNHIYQLAPEEEITKEQYDQMLQTFPKIDYSKLNQYEENDNTEGAKSYACAGDRCEL